MNKMTELEKLEYLASQPGNAKEKTAAKRKLAALKLALAQKEPTGQTERSPDMSRDRKDNIKTQKPKPKK